MTSDWRTPGSEAVLTGRVVYRCAACGGDIEPAEAILDTDDTGTTRTYHQEHAPDKEPDHGS